MQRRNTLADVKESESSRAAGAGIGSNAKNDRGAPTINSCDAEGHITIIVIFSSDASMQEPTPNIQKEQMDSPMEMGAQEHREQQKVRLNETLSNEMSKTLVVKAKSAHPSMITPMMESLGLTVFLDPVPSSKDGMTKSSVHAIDGIDVVTALAPEENVWQFEVTIYVREKISVSGRTGIICDCEP